MLDPPFNIIRIKDSGKLFFWDGDGSIIRRNREVIHADRATHTLKRSEIEVHAGDCLEAWSVMTMQAIRVALPVFTMEPWLKCPRI